MESDRGGCGLDRCQRRVVSVAPSSSIAVSNAAPQPVFSAKVDTTPIPLFRTGVERSSRGTTDCPAKGRGSRRAARIQPAGGRARSRGGHHRDPPLSANRSPCDALEGEHECANAGNETGVRRDGQPGGMRRMRPPDTTGDVGPNHYIQMVNATKVAIYNRAVCC